MNFLLDANAVSELVKSSPNPGCFRWINDQSPIALATSTITLGEIWQGVLGLGSNDKRQPVLQAFAENLPRTLRLIRFDEKAAKVWGQITRRRLSPIPVRDSFIAAIALSRNLTVVTGDEKPFKQAGCRVLNPFTA